MPAGAYALGVHTPMGVVEMIYAVNEKKEHRIVSTKSGMEEMIRCYLNTGETVIQADADGWIEWSGGASPLPDGADYEVLSHDRESAKLKNPEADNWDGEGPEGIAFYRPVFRSQLKPAEEEVSTIHCRCVSLPTLKPQAEQVKGWRGPQDGLPPVGTVCEVDTDEKWQECSVIAHFRQPARMVAAFTLDANNGSKRLDYCIEEHFRPTRTDREQWVDRALYLITPAPSPKMLAEAIYDALASGEFEPPARN